ncbi:ORF099 [Spodoptera frugiperda granulovirus]|uniref:ORF099 n=1 Tax=Spodoptera frugiperda granulovirus TaxID=307454 RepID=A0A0C5B366_9BBAC|nr:ORF099 [Spodoptera frugiperda granulovirus]AJK91760.1 ORF099 [Spodoptera frugiperda granulovirus]
MKVESVVTKMAQKWTCVEFAKKELASRIEECKYIEFSEDTREELLCCPNHNSVVQNAIHEYDMLELLQTCERWYKKLHRKIKCKEQFVKTFIASLPTDVFVLLNELGMEKGDSCAECETKCKRYPGKNGYDFYNNWGLISLASCFCHVCGNEMLYVENAPHFIFDCKCDDDFVVLEGLCQFYCLGCGNEEKDSDEEEE